MSNKYRSQKIQIQIVDVPEHHLPFVREAVIKMTVGKAPCGLCGQQKKLAAITIVKMKSPLPDDQEPVDAFTGLCQECLNDDGANKVKIKMASRKTIMTSFEEVMKERVQDN